MSFSKLRNFLYFFNFACANVSGKSTVLIRMSMTLARREKNPGGLCGCSMEVGAEAEVEAEGS